LFSIESKKHSPSFTNIFHSPYMCPYIRWYLLKIVWSKPTIVSHQFLEFFVLESWYFVETRSSPLYGIFIHADDLMYHLVGAFSYLWYSCSIKCFVVIRCLTQAYFKRIIVDRPLYRVDSLWDYLLYNVLCLTDQISSYWILLLSVL
jgi:hypothetical protein